MEKISFAVHTWASSILRTFSMVEPLRFGLAVSTLKAPRGFAGFNTNASIFSINEDTRSRATKCENWKKNVMEYVICYSLFHLLQLFICYYGKLMFNLNCRYLYDTNYVSTECILTYLIYNAMSISILKIPMPKM